MTNRFLAAALITATALFSAGIQAQTRVDTYIVVPSDLAWSQDEVDSVKQAMLDIQAWYQFRTCGSTFLLPDTFEVQIFECQHERAYYDDGWWDILLPEMEAAGVPVWEQGHILALWIKGVSGAGIGLGAHWCNDACGVAMASVEGWPAFNPGTYCDPCPSNINPSGSVWPCVPRGTMAHELGHAFGLPHADDESYGGANAGLQQHSLMQYHWNFPYWYASGNEAPWGLLATEVQRLWANSALSRDVQLVPSYPDAPIVNLPVLGPVPEASFTVLPEGDSLWLMSTSTNADQHYWIFDDAWVSTSDMPFIARPDGPLEVQLLVSSPEGMMARAVQTLPANAGLDEQMTPSTRVFPNPARDRLEVIRRWGPGEQWSVRSVTGAVVEIPAHASGDRLALNVSGLAPGIYLLEVQGGDHREIHRVVVQ